MTNDFNLSSSDLKHYPHFDAPISLEEVKELVTNRKKVASNKFFPFLLYNQNWQPHRTANPTKPDKKSRPIRYAARRDAYIFAHYRGKLSPLYEERLAQLGISDCPIAYRRIPIPGKKGGKCNIDFAKDPFDEVDRLQNCVAIALDIKGYFENISHDRIKKIWCDLLQKNTLPSDHYAVYKNITRYSFVCQHLAYNRLGFIGEIERDGRRVIGYTTAYGEIPKQLCSPKDFRQKICGGDPELPSIVQKNNHRYGIPQGAPISDLIANFYLIDFDAALNEYTRGYGGKYMRYSDDILIIIPGGEYEANEAIKFVSNEIKNHGDKLEIKKSKTCVVKFSLSDKLKKFEHIQGNQGKNGLEYLGFRYDGKKIYVRDSTISGLYRKVAKAAKRDGFLHVSLYPDMNSESLVDNFNYSEFSQKFSRVKRDDFNTDHSTWTFYTYLKRAAATFGPKGDKILQQARKFKKFMRTRVKKSIQHAYSQRSAPPSSIAGDGAVEAEKADDVFGGVEIEVGRTKMRA